MHDVEKFNLVYLFIGPPIIIPIGALLETGNVLLNDGIEIEMCKPE